MTLFDRREFLKRVVLVLVLNATWLKDAEKEAILSGNAARLLRIV